MISLDEINAEIENLENQSASYATIEKLAWLYIVRDHLPVPKGSGCSGKSTAQVISVMDELLETLSIIQPRLYDAVMERLS